MQWLCTVSCFRPRLFLLPPFHIIEIFAYRVMVELSPAVMRYGLLIQVYYYVDVTPAATLLTVFFLSLFNIRDMLGYIVSLYEYLYCNIINFKYHSNSLCIIILFVCCINSYANPADYTKILHKVIAFFKPTCTIVSAKLSPYYLFSQPVNYHYHQTKE